MNFDTLNWAEDVDWLMARARRVLGGGSQSGMVEAGDLVGEALASALAFPARIPREQRARRRWLATLVERRWVDHLRRGSGVSFEELSCSTPARATASLGQEFDKGLLSALGSADPETQLLVLMRVVLGASDETTAFVLGISRACLRQRFVRMKRNLAVAMTG